MALKIRTNEEKILRIWLESSSIRLSRKAWIVHEFIKGTSTKELSQAVAMPEQRILEVIDRYTDEGLIGLIERPRDGRKKKLSSGEVLRAYIEMSGRSVAREPNANEIASYLNVSKDIVWNQAKQDGLSLTRVIHKDHLVLAPQGVNPLLVGMVFSKNVNFLAFVNTPKLNDSRIGKFLGASKQLIADLKKIKLEPTILDILQIMKVANVTPSSKRNNFETKEQWARNICVIAKNEKAITKIYVWGNYESDEMIEWLKILKKNNLTQSPNGLCNLLEFHTNKQDWLKTCNLSKNIDTDIGNNQFLWVRASN